MSRDLAISNELVYNVIIADESHYLKNRDSKRSKVIIYLFFLLFPFFFFFQFLISIIKKLKLKIKIKTDRL